MSETLKLPYASTFEHAFDEKGRITVPKEWRGEGFENRLHIMPSHEACLKVYPAGFLAEKMRSLSAASVNDPRRKALEKLAANIQAVELDPQNRISVSEPLRAALKLGRNAVLAGKFDHFEIWNREKWRAETAGSGSLTVESALAEAGF